MNKAQAWSTDDADPLPERVIQELEAARIEPGRPLIAVDADEVLVHFAEHFREHVEARGYSFNLVEYRLDTALRGPDGGVVSREDIQALIWGFIETETRNQRAIEGAANALTALEDVAQIIVLTNAPAKMREDRIANLADLGMRYPVVMNEGGKGRALRWISERAAAPVAFVDDSVAQHGSAAKHAPEVIRLHMVIPEALRPIIGHAEGARARLHDWEDAAAHLREILG